MPESSRGVAETPRDPGTFVALAPMDGVTDWVHRELITELNGGTRAVSLCVSEFVRVVASAVPYRVLRRHCPELEQGGRTASGVPVFVQLLGGDPAPMARTALEAAAHGAPGIDLNFGCPAKRVNQHDGGAALLRAPARIESVVSAVRRAVPAGIPVSAKIRTGWEDAAAVVGLARAAERGGADWLVIHGRTRMQMYQPPADWEAIGRAREALAIPVVANGDITSVASARCCRRVTGCRALMVGRGVMARPRIFRALAEAWERPEADGGADDDACALAALLLVYARRMVHAGQSERAALGRVKQWLCLAHKTRPELALLFDRVKRAGDMAQARAILTALSAEKLLGGVAHLHGVATGLYDGLQLVLGGDA